MVSRRPYSVEVDKGEQVHAGPSADVLAQIDGALTRDDTRMGDVLRGKRAALTNSEIARQVNAHTRVGD